MPATIRARPGQVNESGEIVVQNPKQKRDVGAPPSVGPLIPARSGCGAAARHAKSESTSRPLRNANGHLLTRPGGRERPVSAQGRISRFRPIWGSQADMDGPGQADADGAIRRIGPSQAAGACTGGRGRVRAPRHVRWSDPRRVASHGGRWGRTRFRRDFAPPLAREIDAKRPLCGFAEGTGAWAHRIAHGERGVGRRAPARGVDMK